MSGCFLRTRFEKNDFANFFYLDIVFMAQALRRICINDSIAPPSPTARRFPDKMAFWAWRSLSLDPLIKQI
jgi:hypothetical protein